MRVLFVEDSERLQHYVTEGFRQAGYAVDGARDGEEGLWAAEDTAYDVIVLDIKLPRMDGLTVLQQLRARGNETHVLMLTARDTVADRVTGLSAGADDYLIKPFAMEELLARVQVLTRRSYGVKSALIVIGDLVINTALRSVQRGGAAITLKPREYALLEFLAFRQGNVVSRADIEHHIYDERVEPSSNVVDSAMCILRKKIDVAGEPSLIQTRRGMGYVLVGPEP